VVTHKPVVIFQLHVQGSLACWRPASLSYTVGQLASPFKRRTYQPVSTQHGKRQKYIHPLSGIRTHDPVVAANKTRALDGSATVIGCNYHFREQNSPTISTTGGGGYSPRYEDQEKVVARMKMDSPCSVAKMLWLNPRSFTFNSLSKMTFQDAFPIFDYIVIGCVDSAKF
jgi:hypothetical protein